MNRGPMSECANQRELAHGGLPTLVAAILALTLQGQELGLAQSKAPPALVGEHGRHGRLIFEGQRYFSREQLVGALRFNVDFLIASEPQRSMPAFLTKLERLIELGYRGNGFGDAKVAVTWDETRQSVVTRIAEGDRYLSGDVRVEGGRTLSREILRTMLLSTNKFADRPSAPGGVADEKESAGPIWKPTAGVDFTRLGELGHLATIKRVLFLAGYPYAKFSRKLLPQPDGSCIMLVAIEDEGLQARIGGIKITGARRNSADAVLRHLGLTSGQPYNARIGSVIKQQLIDDGRFIDYTLDASPVDDRGEVQLTIGVWELDEAPPLGEELSEIQALLLKCQQWLESPDRDAFDLEFRVRTKVENPPPDFAALLVLSSAGLLVEVEARGQLHRTVAILSQTNLTLAIPPLGRRVEAATTDQLTAFFQTTAGEDWSSKGRFSLQLGAGISSLTNESVVAFSLRALPASLLSFSDELALERPANDLSARLRGPASSFEIERRTGRLIQATIKTPDDEFIEISTQRGRFNSLKDQLSGELGALTNQVSDVHPVSTAIAGFLRLTLLQPAVHEALLSSFKSRNTVERTVAGLQMLDWEKTLQPIEGLWSSLPRGFNIPADVEAGGALPQGALEVYGSYLAGAGTELFPSESFLWQGCRLAGFAFAQREPLNVEKYLMTRRGSKPAEGPVAMWVIARLLHQLGAETEARSAANEGYRMLSAVKFRGEMSTLLSDQSVASRCLQQLGYAIADDADADRQQMAAAFGPPWSDFIHETATAIRQQPAQPLAKVWLPVWERLWRNGLEEAMEKDFFQMASPSARK